MPESETLNAVAEEVALLEDELTKLSRRGLLAFTKFTKPDYDINWHHKIVAHKLDQVLAGKIRRLMILEPPQNGKSEQVSRRFPAYAFGRNPNIRIISLTYSDSLSQDMSRDVQKVMSSKEYKMLFPNVRLGEAKDVEKRTQGQFDVVGGSGYYIAAGIMGSVTGKTCDIGIVDDPIKNRAEAESQVYRDRVWDQFTSAFMTRQFGDKGAIILCMTPWHEDDVRGRLLKLAAENPDADQWDVVSFQAIAEIDERHRRKGEALWPAKYPLPELQRRRLSLGEYDWSALYQQNPAPSGGGLFKEEWFSGRFVDASPIVARRARGWDTAATDGGGDYTAGVKIAEADGIFYVEDVVRGQWTPGVAEKKMQLAFELDGRECAQREEQEGGAAGKAVIEAHIKKFAGWNYEGVPITGSKVTRSKPFRIQCEAGNVRIVRGAWNREYIAELCGFPTGKHDDQVDGSSAAFNAVLLEEQPFNFKEAGMTSAATW